MLKKLFVLHGIFFVAFLFPGMPLLFFLHRYIKGDLLYLVVVALSMLFASLFCFWDRRKQEPLLRGSWLWTAIAHFVVWVGSLHILMRLSAPPFMRFLEWVNTREMARVPGYLIVYSLPPVLMLVGSLIAFWVARKLGEYSLKRGATSGAEVAGH